jgi:hypothetical protein
LESDQDQEVELYVHVKPTLPPEVIEARRLAGLEEATVEKQISVPKDRPTTLHPLAAATEKALKKAKPDEEGFLATSGAGKFDTHVGPGSIDRVFLLIHAMLVAASERGHRLSSEADVRIIVDEQPLAVRIYETKSKAPHIPTPAELKQQAKEDEWRSSYRSDGQSTHKVYRTWDYFPSGRLMLEISDPNQARWKSDPIVGRWRDRPARHLEDCLGDVMAALKSGGIMARLQRAKEAEEARIEKEEQQRCREEEKQERRLENVTVFLVEKADSYAQLMKLENLAAHFASETRGAHTDEFPELNQAIDLVLSNLRSQLSAEAINEEIIETELLKPDEWW